MEEHQQSMKQILIMGDSWGVPEYSLTPGELLSDPTNVVRPKFWLDAEPNYTDGIYHTDQYLRGLGYDVYNSAQGGISNVQAIRRAISCIKNEKLNPDLIIWFHTALFRDYQHFQWQISLLKSYEQAVDDLAEAVYGKMANFLKENNDIPFIAVGGQAPLVKHVFDKYLNPFFRVDDWRSEILQEKLPEFQAFGSEPMLHSWTWHPETIKKLLSISDLYRDKMTALSNSAQIEDPLFPDGCHPGRTPHYELTKKIHDAISWFYKNNQKHDYIKTPGNAL